MALYHEDGKWRSEISPEEQKEQLVNELQSLTDEEREVLDLMLKESGVDLEQADMPSLLSMATAAEYEREVVDIETWLEDPYYFGKVGDTLYPELKKDVISIFNGDFDEVVYSGSIGFGKTFVACVIVARMIYELSCLVDPRRSYGLGGKAPISFPCYSVDLQLAKKVVFSNLVGQLEQSPYFQEVVGYKPTVKNIVFPSKNIVVEALASTPKAALGENVFGSIMDESNFTKVLAQKHGGGEIREQYQEADILYNSVMMRIKSRFLRYGRIPGMMVLLSSKTSETSFLERKLNESRANSRIFVRDYALYEVKPGYEKSRRFQVLVGKGQVRSRLLAEGEDVSDILRKNEDCRVIEVPEEFRSEFDRNLEESLRDIAGVSTETLTPFIHRLDKVYDCVDENRVHPFSCISYDPMSSKDGFEWRHLIETDSNGFYQPLINPDIPRFVHIDPSDLVQGGDCAAIVVGHIAGRKTVIRKDREGNSYSEDSPIIYIDLMLQIVPPQNQEVSLGEVRQLVYQLSEHGFMIRNVTMDNYQSHESIHKFKERGYTSEVLSVDRTSDPYVTLKEAFYEDRIMMYKYEPVLKELKDLEKDERTGKIDHKKDGSKDVADALAAVVYALSRKSKEDPMLMMKGISVGPPADNSDTSWLVDKQQNNNGIKTLKPSYPKRMDDILSDTLENDKEDDFVLPIMLL